MHSIIGGEFIIENIPCVTEGEICSCERGFALGRTSFYAILKNLEGDKAGGKTILIPDYICESVPNTIKDCGWNYSFYHIDESLLPVTETIREADAILFVDYFGVVSLGESVGHIRKEYPNMKIVLDEVQDLFGFYEEKDFDHAFTSLRKWLPVPDGSFVKSKATNDPVSFKEVKAKGEFVNYKLAGNYLKKYEETIGAQIALELIEKGESLLDKDYLYEMSPESQKLFGELDLESIKKKRIDNALYIHQKLESASVPHLYSPNKPQMFVPIFVKPEVRNELRNKLFEANIFCPIHWKYVDRETSGENELYSKELSLICDQRYDKNDLDRMLEIVINAFGIN